MKPASHQRTLVALQVLVRCMAETKRAIGKRTLFGKNKALEPYARFLAALQEAVLAMHDDSLIQGRVTIEVAQVMLLGSLRLHQATFPDWDDAWPFAQAFIGGTPLALDVAESIENVNNAIACRKVPSY